MLLPFAFCLFSLFVIMYYYFILEIRYIRKISNHTITLDPDTFVRTLPPRPWAARSPLVTSGASASSCGRRTCRSPQHDRGRADRPGIACAQAMSLHAWPGLGVSVGQCASTHVRRCSWCPRLYCLAHLSDPIAPTTDRVCDSCLEAFADESSESD